MIKNIVFDFGNVLVEWNPTKVVAELFPEHDEHKLTEQIFKSPTWRALNAGKLTEQEAIMHYHHNLQIELILLRQLLDGIKHAQHPIMGSHELLLQLHNMNRYGLYALTDNVHEIIAYLKQRYTFFDYFKGVVISANVGHLKPATEIYRYLLDTYQLNPAETVFLDDVAANIAGAQAMGMQGIQFHSTEQCIGELKKLGVVLD